MDLPNFKLVVYDNRKGGDAKGLGSIMPVAGMKTSLGIIVGFTKTGKSLRIKCNDGIIRTVRSYDNKPGVKYTEAVKFGFFIA